LHKRQCRALAEAEFLSTFGHCTQGVMERLLHGLEPSSHAQLLKLSAITWTLRHQHPDKHIVSLNSRAILIDKGRPAPGDTKEKLIHLLKRATTELPWPPLPQGLRQMFAFYVIALNIIAKFGEPEAAVEILKRHVEDVERHVTAPNRVATYLIYRLDWLLSAAIKVSKDTELMDAYLAEAKGVMERAAWSLRGLQSQDWGLDVSL
jgi:hypothetical protein